MSLRALFSLVILCCTTAYAQPPRLVLLVGHTKAIQSVVFSHNKKFILTASEDNTAKLWDAPSGKLLYTLTGHQFYVRNARFSPDDKYIITSSWDEAAKIWETNTGKLIQTLACTGSMLSDALFSPDGNYIITIPALGGDVSVWSSISARLLYSVNELEGTLAVGFAGGDKWLLSANDSVYTRNFSTGATINSFRAPAGEADYCLFSADAKKMIRIEPGSVHLWDVATGKLEKSFPIDCQVIHAAFNVSNSKISLAHSCGKLSVLDIKTGKLLFERNAHSKLVYQSLFTEDEKKIITISADKKANIWDAVSGKLLQTINGHDTSIVQSAISAGDNYFLTGDSRGTVKAWRIADGKPAQSFDSHTSGFRDAVFSHNGSWFATASDDNIVRIWKGSSGKLLFSLKGHSIAIKKIAFSPNDKLLLTADADGSVFLWEVASGKLLRTLKGHTHIIYSAVFSDDGKRILTASHDNTARLWETESGKLIKVINAHKLGVQDAEFSPSGNFFVTASIDKTAMIWDAKNFNLLTTLRGSKGFVRSVSFNKEETRILTIADDNTARLWDMATGQPIREFNTQGNSGTTATFSHDGKKMITCNTYATIWDVATTTITGRVGTASSLVQYACFSKDDTYILTVSSDNIARLWETATGKLHKELAGHTNDIESARFSENNAVVLTASADATCRKWSVASGREMASWIAVDENDYVNIIPPGYYQCSRNANRLLYYVTPDLKIIDFKQFDIRYNRPDKVLQSVLSRDTLLATAYAHAYEKRIARLGIDTLSFKNGFNIPQASIANREQVNYEQGSNKLSLQIKAADSVSLIDRVNIWINDVPLFGKNGIDYKNKKLHTLDTTFNIILSPGKNKIETSVTNNAGTESLRSPLFVNYNPVTPEQETVWFIGIGIDHFANNQYDLRYSAKDIRDIAIALKKRYPSVRIDTLMNAQVTRANILQARERIARSGINDKVIVAYSGHGLLNKNFDYYLSTYPVDFATPEKNGLPYDELESLINAIPARKKLLLIDACHSGEVDKQDLVTLQATSDTAIKGLKPVAYKEQGQVGLQNSFDLMQSIFVDVGNSTGATVIAAAAGTQFALERNELRNGVFTYSILQALAENRAIRVSRLVEKVSEKVSELTNGMQQPGLRNENRELDWEL